MVRFPCWLSGIDLNKLPGLQFGHMAPQAGGCDPVLLCGRLWENKITFSTAFHSHAKIKVSGPDTKGTELWRQHQSISNLYKSFFVVARLGRQPGNNRGFGSSFGHIMFLPLCGECGQRAWASNSLVINRENRRLLASRCENRYRMGFRIVPLIINVENRPTLTSNVSKKILKNIQRGPKYTEAIVCLH